MNEKTVQRMSLVESVQGSTTPAFAAPALINIEDKTRLLTGNPSSPGYLPIQMKCNTGEATVGSGKPKPPPPPPPPPTGIMAQVR